MPKGWWHIIFTDFIEIHFRIFATEFGTGIYKESDLALAGTRYMYTKPSFQLYWHGETQNSAKVIICKFCAWIWLLQLLSKQSYLWQYLKLLFTTTCTDQSQSFFAQCGVQTIFSVVVGSQKEIFVSDMYLTLYELAETSAKFQKVPLRQHMTQDNTLIAICSLLLWASFLILIFTIIISVT